jgi:hypothetical protein
MSQSPIRFSQSGVSRIPGIVDDNKGEPTNSISKSRFTSIYQSSFFLFGLVALGSCITLAGCGGVVPNSNAASAVGALTCTNSSITGAATDSCSVTLTSPASAAVTVNLSSSNAAVAVPATVTVAFGSKTASFTATATAVTAAESVTLTSTANGGSQTFTVKLNPEVATGPTGPTLTINSSSVAFGNVAVGVPSTQSLTLTSAGTAAVTVSSAAVSGSGFTESGVTFPVTLNPGQSATLNLQFEPTATGADTGKLTVASTSSSNASAVIPLSGTGIPLQIGLSWDAPTGTTATVSGYNVYRATGSSSTFAKLNSSLNSPTSFTDGSVAPDTTYEYYVTSVDSAGVESSPSNTATVAVP